MAPSFRPSKNRPSRDDEDFFEARGDRKARKPLVEKKRRARINESLQELRLILADTEFQAKMENAEVLELTVKRVQGILQNRSLDGDKLQREASERFAAGYIQCMHEVHTFVSNCPGIDSTIAAELLNHLLESMPLNEGSFQDLIADVLSDPSIGQWPGSDGLSQTPGESLGALNLPSPNSPLPSPSSSEETCSDVEDTEAEQSHISLDGLDRSRTQNVPCSSLSKSMWRPW
ncbi:transcription cofactor HES-6 [Zootoca vivipara]|uniref:transcription cofactor HES-6 n=1 Tax=Zootoca vivipara TaxID=8524 RepID=UPI001590D40A|nr:transcription cofactor HES-6-like [Zootoca vivipara]XP_034989567.1 transcription cofactor HES-6-like [Zootoca vivipara]XP_034989568.1 transcription cofactor HES-6-like [Zootoca vivipara]XP_034989569.1 transcription cofactor HES-6-like [Zootoca vivipara]XP_034989570.1 transcription cofactor HES-6-like [Zootoca vivipara]XP_060130550.1 transcription cofactor HES-6 [Zootoca vivipara]XP_060130551.1 transcription cofactor HES-6 [Zootoca vivipara]